MFISVPGSFHKLLSLARSVLVHARPVQPCVIMTFGVRVPASSRWPARNHFDHGGRHNMNRMFCERPFRITPYRFFEQGIAIGSMSTYLDGSIGFSYGGCLFAIEHNGKDNIEGWRFQSRERKDLQEPPFFASLQCTLLIDSQFESNFSRSSLIKGWLNRKPCPSLH